MRNMRISVIDEEGKNAGETVDGAQKYHRGHDGPEDDPDVHREQSANWKKETGC